MVPQPEPTRSEASAQRHLAFARISGAKWLISEDIQAGHGVGRDSCCVASGRPVTTLSMGSSPVKQSCHVVEVEVVGAHGMLVRSLVHGSGMSPHCRAPAGGFAQGLSAGCRPPQGIPG